MGPIENKTKIASKSVGVLIFYKFGGENRAMTALPADAELAQAFSPRNI